ncbi:MAG: HlyD family secretion protein [Terriglobales bacterium]
MKRWGWIVIVAAAVVAGLYFGLRPKAQTLVLTGTVDGNEVVVGSQITGRITRLAVQDGDAVTAGEVLATLDQGVQQADAVAASAAIQQAQASARQSQDQTALLEATLAARVQQAQAQQAQVGAQLAEARAGERQAAANWDKAEANYRRTVPLAAKGVSSPLELDNAKADLDGATAARASAAAQITAAQKSVAAAAAALTDARQQQRQVQVQRQQTAALQAAWRQASANHQAALVRLGQTEITAPIAGVVTLRAAREGEVVNPGGPIVTLFDLAHTWVDADVEETYAPLIRLGEQLQVKLPDGALVRGPVIYKAVEADFATQRDVSRTKRDIKTVAIRVAVPNPHGELALGMTAWVVLPVPPEPPELQAGVH